MKHRWLYLLLFFVLIIQLPVPAQCARAVDSLAHYTARLELVRVDSGIISLYYFVVETSSCGELLGQYSLNISNAATTSFVLGDLQYRNFQMFDDTCVSEQVTYKIDGEKLKPILKASGKIFIIIMGQGRALVYTMTEWDKKTMLKLFQEKLKSNDIESTL